MKSNRKASLCIPFLVGAAGASCAIAQAPLGTAFTYQGQLKSGGNTVSGPHDLRFRLYDAAAAGNQFGPTVCRDNVAVTDGLFTATLDVGPFYGQELFIEVDVRADTGLDCTNATGFTTLSPRQPLTATPYSLFAANVAAPLNLYASLPAMNIITGTNNAGGNGSTGVFGEAFAAVGVTHGVRGLAASTDGRAVSGAATATTGVAFGGLFESASSSGRGVFGYATSVTGTNYGVAGRADGSAGTGVHGFAGSGTGTTYGGFFQTQSTSGTGVYGRATAASGSTYGGYFQSDSPGGRAVYGEATADSGTNFGGYFRSDGPSGRAVYGVSGAVAGVTYGGYFETSTTLGRGVFGHVTASTGTNYGVRGQSDSIAGIGVSGAVVANGPTNTAVGVRGEAPVSSAGFAVQALGDFSASGLKAFRIDHPLDPTNKYLMHYASESPFPQNFYNGNVMTDAHGFAWVDLPDYFAAINTNFKYQLTVIDSSADFVLAKVTREIENNRFQIRTSKPGVKVSWEVMADRSDARVRYKRPTDERVKVGAERGGYQHPEFYGLPVRMATE